MNVAPASVDVVMLGTFSPWQRGTLQARALPLARCLLATGIQCVLVTTPWDMSYSAGEIDSLSGIPVITTRSVSPKKAAIAAREQLQWVHRLQPEIIHLFKPKGFGGLASFAHDALSRSPATLIVDCDDWEGDGGWNQNGGYTYLQQRLFEWQESSLVRRAGAVTAASSLLYRRAIDLRGPNGADSVRFIPNALPPDWSSQLCHARELRRHAHRDRTVLLYSRFAEFPGDWLSEYCSALSVLATEPTTITVIGAWPSRSPVTSVGCVTVNYQGYVGRAAIPGLLASGSIAIYPYANSLITRSKQSVKLLELMAAGCPPIASDVGDVARTIGPAGILVPGADPGAFAAATAEALRRPELLDAMSRAGQKRIRYHFDFNQLVKPLSELYKEHGLTVRC